MSLTMSVSSLPSKSTPMPCFVTSSPKTISVLILPLEIPLAICGRLVPISVKQIPVKPRAVRVRIFVRADEQLVGFANARDGIADGAELGFQF